MTPPNPQPVARILPMPQFPSGPLVCSIRSVEKVDGETVASITTAEAVLMVTTDRANIEANKGVITIFAGDRILLPYIAQAAGSFIVQVGLTTVMVEHLMRCYRKEFTDALVLASRSVWNISPEGEPHDDSTEGSDRPIPGGSEGGHGPGAQAPSDGPEEAPQGS